MSIEGSANTKVLRGTITGVDAICIDAYDIAVKNGFEGTEEEWLASLKGDSYTLTEADKDEIADEVQKMFVDVAEVGR